MSRAPAPSPARSSGASRSCPSSSSSVRCSRARASRPSRQRITFAERAEVSAARTRVSAATVDPYAIGYDHHGDSPVRFGLSQTLLVVCAVLAGCGGATDCPALSVDMQSLAAKASSMELDVYDATASCDGNDIAAGAPAPLVSRTLGG